jgi:hypothetical protein
MTINFLLQCLLTGEGMKNSTVFLYMVVYILCFVDSAYRYICVMKTNLMHYLSSVYFVNKPLHVSGLFIAHHQEVYCVCVCVCIYIYIYIYINKTIGACCAFQLSVGRPAGRQTVN